MAVVWFFCCLFMIVAAGSFSDRSARVVGYLSGLCFFVAFVANLLTTY